MKRIIRKVAVLGSGTMGSGIAAHLANANIRSFLLDIVPTELSEAEKKKGLTLESPEVRNRIATSNKEQFILKFRPPVIMDKDDADLITVGNMEDNLDWLSECDWIVEVVPENLEIKKQVLKKIQPYIKPGTIVTTNTSGISINGIAEDMPLEFRQYWLGTHFFNPVRYMKLLEIIPGKDTLPEIMDFMIDFGERVLGKGIVLCKDTPNFIANRIGCILGCSILKINMELGLSAADIDAITGSALGRPGTGCYGLYDLVGLDIGVHSSTTVHDNVTDPAEKEKFTFPAYINEMMKRKMLGNKTKGGFYKKQGKEKLMLDFNTLEYVPVKTTEFPSLTAARSQKTLAGKLEAFFEGDDAAAKLVWQHMKEYFLYATAKIPEISDDLLYVDRALRWGYNHGMGPFESWNGVDLKKYVARMESEGEVVSGWVKKMLDSGFNSFYKTEGGIDYCYSPVDNKYRPIESNPKAIVLKDLRVKNKVVKTYESAGTLYDLGDGVLGFEIATPNTALSVKLMDALIDAKDELYKNWDGMVVTSSGKNFCVGANLKEVLPAIEAQDWKGLDDAVRYTQDVEMGLKYSLKPIVMAPYAMALGGGCELVMHSSAIQAAGELYIGLVEVGVGLIPGGGGVKEMTMRALERVKGTSAFAIDFIIPYLQNIITAKVSSSAKDAVKLGYLRPTDRISLSSDLQVAEAKKRVLEMNDNGFAPPVSRPFPAPGLNETALVKTVLNSMREAGIASEHDVYIGEGVLYIMSGGGVTRGAMITEQYLLDLEREVFIDLCKTAKTQDRIRHMLTKGKPLRN